MRFDLIKFINKAWRNFITRLSSYDIMMNYLRPYDLQLIHSWILWEIKPVYGQPWDVCEYVQYMNCGENAQKTK